MPNILSLDLSTKTGWSYFEGAKLVDIGTFTCKVPNYVSNIKVWSDIPDSYPYNILDTAIKIGIQCSHLWWRLGHPYIVIEHTEGSKHRISQRTLEFIHAAVFSKLLEYEHIYYPMTTTPKFNRSHVKYLLNSDWRRVTNCYISQWPEMQKWNKEVGKAKKKATPTKSGAKVAKIDGKIVSKWDAKKLSIYIAKSNYPDFADKITTDDIADSVNMGHAAIKLGIFDGVK